jgi:hypothetical protein
MARCSTAPSSIAIYPQFPKKRARIRRVSVGAKVRQAVEHELLFSTNDSFQVLIDNRKYVADFL